MPPYSRVLHLSSEQSLREEVSKAKAGGKRGKGDGHRVDYDDRTDVEQYKARIEQLEADLKRRQVRILV
jgi:hypothetical protein